MGLHLDLPLDERGRLCHTAVLDQAWQPSAELARCETWLDGQPAAGASASFVGRVRQDTRERGPGAPLPLQALTLEHYPGMTERQLARLAAQAMDRFDLLGVQVLHRIGRLQPGDPIVWVWAAAPHRVAALQAVDFLMDHLKSCVTFWKKEDWGSESSWVAAKPADHERLARWQVVTGEPPSAVSAADEGQA